MRKIRAVWMRLMHVLFGQRPDDDFSAELESHIAMHIEDGMRAGLSETEARRQALVGLGGAEQVRQAYRDRATLPFLEHLLQDVAYAMRGFRRNPTFALTAILTLALGIGATTAVFTVVDRILFRSLPYAHDDRLVSFGLAQSLERQEFTLGGFFYEWRDNQKPFQSVTFERGVGQCNLEEHNPVQLSCAWVAANFLSTLGVSPVLGRNFLPEEDVPGGAKVVLISDSLWLNRFNRSADALNRSLDIDGHAMRIVGVLPSNFEMPRLQQADILMPAQMDVAAQHTVNAGIGYPMWAFARLKPGVTIAEARAEMEPLFRHTQAWIPPQLRNEFHLQVRSVRDRQMQDAYQAAWVLLGAVIAVLLIACANVASLFSARGVARERELAMRSALGASRTRLVVQALTEAAVLALAGGAAGCLLAEVLLRVFIAIAPAGIPFLASARIGLRIISFTAAAAAASALLFGILPAIQQPGPGGLLARSNGTGPRLRLRQALVSAQIGMSVVLLSGAMLLAKSFRNLEAQNLGMQTRGVLVLHTPLANARYPDGHAYMDFYLRAEEALRRLPGVTAVGLSDSLPPDANSWHDGIRFPDIIVAGRAPTPASEGGTVVSRHVTPDYFRALQIPIIDGRGFSEGGRTTNDNPIILSRQLAHRLFPGEDPVGRQLRIGDYAPYLVLNGPTFTVVGVAGDVKNGGLSGQDDPEIYTLRRNRPEDWSGHAVILVETALPPSVMEPWARAQIAQLDPTVPVNVERLKDGVAKLADRPRFETAMMSFFALTGLVMAVIGLYGVITCMTMQRTHEIGIRMALGARRGDVLLLILKNAVFLVGAGLVPGIVFTWFATRAIKSSLFGVSEHDPAIAPAVSALLIVCGLIAALVPARRAASINPTDALRAE